VKKIISFLILSLLLCGNVFAGTCKTPKNPKEKFVLAPEPVSYTRKSPTNRIEEVLSKRKTINVFRAFNQSIYGSLNYGLYWEGGSGPALPIQTGFALQELYWHYYHPDRPYNQYPGIEKFVTKKRFQAKGHEWKEYGRTYHIRHIDKDYPPYFADLVFERAKNWDGLFFDWWHDEMKSVKGYPKNQIKKSRRAIAKALRDKMGSNFLLLGNLNWRYHTNTHDYLNGVFMELYKLPSNGYSCSQINEVNKLLKYHDKNLQEPRLIALEPWKISKAPPKEIIDKLEQEKFRKKLSKDQYKRAFKMSKKKYWAVHYRSSEENIKFAKLFTAMAMVIPENGYILYGDNNPDNLKGDHFHDFYDFYNTDLGKETSIGMEITEGVGFKMYEKGVIVYNYTKERYKIKFTNQKEVTIDPLEGMFVEF
jgi:hypothetical protein